MESYQIPLVLLLTILSANAQTSSDETLAVVNDYLLPTSVVPIHYDIKLIPYLDDDNFTFDGEVNIKVRADEVTDVITLHQNDTIIEESSVTVTDLMTNINLIIVNQTYEALYHFYRLHLEENLQVGREYEINIKYKGYLRDDMQGLFKSSYTTSDGETRWLAATHFQPCRARRAFPSFDEPALKATFRVSIARTANRHALSNMPVVNMTGPDPDNGGYIWDHFKETPMPLSTYLMAFIVSDFTNLTTDNYLSLWQRQEAISQAEYSASISLPLLRALEDYTDLHFFLPKMDEVAVPDYQSGATEQWGLVTYRERNILFVEGVSTSSHKQSIAAVIAHEFSHMWFGNLVSPKWWDVLWLNEGFARYFQYFTLAEVEKDWRIEEQFVTAQVHTSLSVDSVNTSHPMTVDVASPEQISAIFDTISYGKGNSSADANDLFTALDEQFTEDVGPNILDFQTIMETWTLQMGYPVLGVIRDYDSGAVTVTQERFLIRPSTGGTDTHDYKWWIPLTYTTKSEMDFISTETRAWLNATDTRATLTGLNVDPADWVVFNIQETGFYRVNYDLTNWGLLAEYLDSGDYSKIIPVNRAQIVDDLFNLARGGYLNYTVVLDLVKYLQREVDYIPWNAALTGLTYVEKRMRGADEYDYAVFKSFLLKLLSTAYSVLGLEEAPSDDHVTKLNRNQILTWVCKLEEPNCVQKAQEIFALHMADSQNNPYTGGHIWRDKLLPIRTNKRLGKFPELPSDDGITDKQGLVVPKCSLHLLAHMAPLRGEQEWNFLWDRFLAYSNVSTEQTLILGILGCTSDETLAHSHNSVDAVVSFISSLSGVVTKSEQADKLKQFIEDNQDALGSSAVTSATNTLVSAERNLAWLDAHAQTIAAWINATDTTTVAPGGGGGGAPSSYSSTTVLLMLLLSTVSCWIGRF
uniref:Aminopeptidase n=1 Tax=Timema bartmani TaxID=61472 RepID=A0A7R9HZW1_9NEOP|nr:unnamed protein product [Timema bartmani]